MTSCIYNVRQLCLVVAVVSAQVTVAAGTPIHNCDWDAAASIDPSIRIMRMSFDEPRLMKGYAIRVDLHDRSLAFTANGRDKDWGRPMPDYTNKVIRTRRVTVSEFLDNARAPVSQVISAFCPTSMVAGLASTCSLRSIRHLGNG